MAGVIENGHTHNPLTRWTLPVLVHVRVWVHILGDPQCSAEECYNNNIILLLLLLFNFPLYSGWRTGQSKRPVHVEQIKT